METLLKKKWLLIGAALLILLIIGIKKTNAPAKTPEQAFISNLESNYLRIDRAVESAVKAELKFPEEAEFEAHEGCAIVDLSANKAGTRGYVMAKNAMGVKSKMHYEAVFVLNNDQVNVERVNLQE